VGRSARPESVLRIIKYLAWTFLVLAIIAAVIHQQRESIARKLANAALSEQGITATELSIDTLGTDFLRLSYLFLEQEDGTRYQIFGLSFPLSFPSIRPESIAIEQVIMTPARVDAGPAPIAPMLQSFLQLPGSMPNTEITISSFAMPDAPVVENIVWRSMGQRQHLAFSIHSVEYGIDVSRVGDGEHKVKVNAAVGDSSVAYSSTLSVQRSDSGFSIEGASVVDLAAWVPVLQSAGLLSGDVLSIAGRLDGPLSIDVYFNETRGALASASLSLAGTMSTDYRVDDDVSVRLQASSKESLQASIEYPSLQWTAAIGQLDMLVTINAVSDVAVRLIDLKCRSGVQCTLQSAVDAGPLKFESVAMASAELSTSLVIADDETTRVTISPDFHLRLSGVETKDNSISSIRATLSSPIELTIDDDSWQADVDRIELTLDSLTDRKGLLASASIAFDHLQFRDGGKTIDSDVSLLPQSSSLSWNHSSLLVPGINGAVSLHENEWEASLTLFDSDDSLSAQVNASHNIGNGTGAISIADAALVFDRRALSRHFPEWPRAWDVISGTLDAELQLSWRTGDDGAEYDGAAQFRADSLAGNYDDIAFSGLNTQLSADVDSLHGVSLSPSSVSVALLDVGIPVQQISADFSVNVADGSVRLGAVAMSVLGGQIVADPFTYRLQQERNSIVLRPQSIQLQFMVDLAEFEDIDLSGSISGVLPMTVSEKKITIINGRLESDPPGGAIRYRPGLDGDDFGVPATDLGLVSRALANFQFDTLTADVNYTENGDLKLQMKLTGINPDMDDRQPVILNLGVENNIPQLLRSLQATRTIEDILEKRSAN